MRSYYGSWPIATGALIPLEVYELAKHFSLGKLAVTAINVLIVWYLVAASSVKEVTKRFAPKLSTVGGRLTATRIMHRLTTECRALLDRGLAASRKRAPITLAIVEIVIDVPVEIGRSAIPGARTNEHTAGEPLRPVITIGSAVVRRNLVISVRAHWRPNASDTHGHMGWAAAGHKHRNTKNEQVQSRQVSAISSLVDGWVTRQFRAWRSARAID